MFSEQDHFAKISFLWPLCSKHAINVADAMIPWLMCYGPMKYAQADNGGEFKGALLILLRRHGIAIINGSPRHPQSQGLVKQGNGTVKA